MRASFALLLSLVTTACAAAGPDVIPIPIDHAGFAGRLRRVCELGKGPGEGACAAGPLAQRPSDADGSADGEEPEDDDDWDAGSDREDAETENDAPGEAGPP